MVESNPIVSPNIRWFIWDTLIYSKLNESFFQNFYLDGCLIVRILPANLIANLY